MDYAQYPRPVLEDVVRLRRQMDEMAGMLPEG